MIAEIRLQSNNVESTATFWSAIFDVPAVQLADGRWRVAPAEGPAVVVRTATVAETISRYCDMTVRADGAAADRLRAAAFEVSLPGWPLSAVDINGTDATVFLVVKS
ncbi:hypothetical protein [Mycolicibacterium sp.]|uniref:hypothetical protein n=1 Tax=Mycolicibacterium sp. TaxID=2320850 RepID=UPI0037CC0501